jgi:hypothetical protein
MNDVGGRNQSPWEISYASRQVRQRRLSGGVVVDGARSVRAASVAERPAIRASASGSMCRGEPLGTGDAHEEVAKALVEPLEWASTRTGAWR